MYIGYARVSTKEQDLTEQLERLEEIGCDPIFSGKQSGDSKINDAKLAEMISFIRKGDVVVITKLDRLGRSLKSIINTIEEIHAKKASLKSLDNAIDTSNDTPYAKAQLALLATFAQLERELIIDRTSEGRKRAMEEGKQFGRPPILSDEQKKKVITDYKRGANKSALSRKYGVSRMTISRIVGSYE
ncbi:MULTISPECIES: recombinase family protein [unclassified Marinobacterium]|uniref:recombinase family protein n=1 Tax=unclassified Marinobacterium TaxID=2644139 RepID=UPI001568E0C5|nr:MULTISPECIES: recombinase family protein [unclassified Marinobacterium]NRP10375.1 DNA-invertase hin [Marinobacterium sp. xm-g-48]NRP83474.1 DNA-invertase hin [Marinobacterium sp. xm-d-509]